MYPDKIIQKLNEIAPPELAEFFDEGRIGLIIEGRKETKKIATALDATLHVIKEAILHDVDMLVVHHTPLWYPITRVTGFYADLLCEVLRSGMHVFVMHTNYDHAPSGVNDCLCEILSFSNKVEMSLGAVGNVSLTLDEIASRLEAPLIVYNRDVYEMIERSSLCLGVAAGSGFDPLLIEEARSLGARAFLSAELKHSVMRQFPDMVLLESTHYALEAPAMKTLAQRNGWLYIEDVPKVSMVR
jgi:dinuclear metal center YbgI/SA1388 family protein